MKTFPNRFSQKSFCRLFRFEVGQVDMAFAVKRNNDDLSIGKYFFDPLDALCGFKDSQFDAVTVFDHFITRNHRCKEGECTEK